MQSVTQTVSALELDAALLQAFLTGVLAIVCAALYRRFRKAYFAWYAIAWMVYALRLGVIISFLLTERRAWLFWHQVLTGWTALALLFAALVFSRGTRWRWRYLAVMLLPLLWSYMAIYRVENFFLAALPAVAFLSLASFWTGIVFLGYRRQVGSRGATVLGVAFLLWSIHHVDYPFLRAQGAWAPWGYYLDIVFVLAAGTGILLLVIDDLSLGLRALSSVTEVLQHRGGSREVLDLILRRPLTLPAVHGSALYLREGDKVVGAAGACAAWQGKPLEGEVAGKVAEVVARGRPGVLGGRIVTAEGTYPYAAVLPVSSRADVSGALILVGDARDPFAALDDDFLIAFGRQVGAALENADLGERLQHRTVELARLSQRMVEQHEEERRRLSRELHDETAQVFSAVKMVLAVLRGQVAPELAARLDRTIHLVDTGIRGIRNVVNDLRPSLLDDLGLLPALRSLVAEFQDRSQVRTAFLAPTALPILTKEAELALFRALQEALSNVSRHAEAQRVEVQIDLIKDALVLDVRDDGRGPATTDPAQLERDGHMGLTGMRERITAVGGSVRFEGKPGEGVHVRIRVPLSVEQ